MATNSTSIFAAEEPTLGYLYQINYSLLLLLQSSEIDNSIVFVEKLDDIQLDQPNLTQLFQTKYHLTSVANLTNASTDLWKTLRVWSEGIKTGLIDIDTTSFHLITTANASDTSVASELRKEKSKRDINQVIATLNAVTQTSDSQTNKKSYEAFNSLSDDQKNKLVNNISILDASVNITELKNKTKAELRKTIIDERVQPLYERLLGWYLEQTINVLLGIKNGIAFKELQQQSFEIIDSLKMDNLPADFPDPIEFTETEIQGYKQRKFVKQLQIVGVNERVIKNAVSDYYRAYEQKSQWVRDCLIAAQDEIDYNKKLQDDWKRKFDALAGDHEASNDNKKKEVGKAFYETHYVNTTPRIFIKPRFEHIYMVTGSCHILSDEKKIGWHPEFNSQIED